MPVMTSTGKRPLGHLDEDESLLVEIHRHPFGLVALYAGALLALILCCIGVVLVMPTVTDFNEDLEPVVIGGLLFLGLFILIGLYIATVVYRESRLVVTDKNITQTLQQSLFNRKISQLSMANVEDVTAEQKGFIPHLLDYGTLFVETAGEQENFKFIYTPHPNAIAKEILEAREKYIEHPRPAYYQNMPYQGPTSQGYHQGPEYAQQAPPPYYPPGAQNPQQPQMPPQYYQGPAPDIESEE